jgi:hypothetical protein
MISLIKKFKNLSMTWNENVRLAARLHFILLIDIPHYKCSFPSHPRHRRGRVPISSSFPLSLKRGRGGMLLTLPNDLLFNRHRRNYRKCSSFILVTCYRCHIPEALQVVDCSFHPRLLLIDRHHAAIGIPYIPGVFAPTALLHPQIFPNYYQVLK